MTTLKNYIGIELDVRMDLGLPIDSEFVRVTPRPASRYEYRDDPEYRQMEVEEADNWHQLFHPEDYV